MQVVSSKINKKGKQSQCFKTGGCVLENGKTFGRLHPLQLQMYLLSHYKILSQKLSFPIFFRDYLGIFKLLLCQTLFETTQ